MTSRSVTLMICVLGAGVILTSAAHAANKKAKQSGAYAPHPASSATAACRGANLYPCGPIYSSYDYLGTDPDPFIRTMIQRDLGAKYGPAE
jgi:hypothetical protein